MQLSGTKGKMKSNKYIQQSTKLFQDQRLGSLWIHLDAASPVNPCYPNHRQTVIYYYSCKLLF